MGQSGQSDTAPIVIQKWIDQQRFNLRQTLIFILCFIVVLADGFDTGIIGFIAPALLEEWGIDRSQLAPVFSAALFGMVAGALIAGPMADRLGRRFVVAMTVFFFGFWSLVSTYSQTVEQLILFRFLTGMGLGAAMPSAATLLSEYLPHRYKAMLVNITFCALPLGIALGGVVSARWMPAYGWRGMLMIGGVVPMALSVFLYVFLPESVQYWLTRKGKERQITSLLNRIFAANLPAGQPYQQEQAPGQSSGVALVVSKPYLKGTLMLWLTCFMSLLVFYLLTNWLPTILYSGGFSKERASMITSVFPVGGAFGALLIGWLMSKGQPNRVLVGSYLIAAVLLAMTGLGYGNSIALFALCLFLAGAALGGAQSSIPALTAMFYPPQGRATGVSWMHGIGRSGAIVGAFVGAELLAMGWSFSVMFAMLAVPLLIAAAALWIKEHSPALAKSLQRQTS